MNHEYRFGAHIGTSSLLLIFLTLSLVSFGALSLAGAKADERLSEKLGEHTAEYYAASHEAEAFVARTDTGLRKACAESADEADFRARTAGMASDLVIPMNDNQSLCVALEFLYPADGAAGADRLCRVVSWRVETRDDADYERHLPVSGSGGVE
ncbi:MAG: hypothetical protein IKO80_01635 [Lachnospiraceae bacterium]|nr:hypothetical protein [Lachnospiraceae bacterium]